MITGLVATLLLCIPASAITTESDGTLTFQSVSLESRYTTQAVAHTVGIKYQSNSVSDPGSTSMRMYLDTINITESTATASTVTSKLWVQGGVVHTSYIFNSTVAELTVKAKQAYNSVLRRVPDPTCRVTSSTLNTSDGHSIYMGAPLTTFGTDVVNIQAIGTSFNFYGSPTFTRTGSNLTERDNVQYYIDDDDGTTKGVVVTHYSNGTMTWATSRGNGAYCSVGSLQNLTFRGCGFNNSEGGVAL